METAYRRSRRSAARRTSSGIGAAVLQRHTELHRLLLERELQDLVDPDDRVERDLVADVLGDVLEVGAVALRDDDVREPCRMGGEHLLLQATDRKDPALERDLAGHAD